VPFRFAQQSFEYSATESDRPGRLLDKGFAGLKGAAAAGRRRFDVAFPTHQNAALRIGTSRNSWQIIEGAETDDCGMRG
jgi:hypothetical protein